MVGPIGVQHTDFRNGRNTFFFLFEILLDPKQVFHAHGQAQFFLHSGNFRFRTFQKALQPFHICRFFPGVLQRLRFFQRRFPGFDRIHQVFFYLFKFSIGQAPLQHIHLGSGNQRFFLLGDQLDALGRKIFPLVILAGQQFYRKHFLIRCGNQFFHNRINRRFRQYQLQRLIKFIF